MKNRAGRLLSILLLVLGLLLTAGRGSAGEETSPQEQDEKVTVYFFHNNPCESCHEGKKFRDLASKTMEGRQTAIPYQIEEYYVYRTDGREALDRLVQELGIPEEEVSYPMVIVGNRWITGYTRMEEELYDCLAQAAGMGPDITGTREPGSGDGDRTPGKAGGEGGLALGNADKGSMNILFFSTESCSSCDKVKEYLKELPAEITADGAALPVNIRELSVMEEENASYLLRLYEAYQVPVSRQKVPVIFIGNRYLSGEKQIRSGLEIGRAHV